MKSRAAIAGVIAVAMTLWCSTSSSAQSDESCAVPGYLLFGDSLLEQVSAAVEKEKALKIVVLGGSSSTLPGADGAKFAYPARLEAALRSRLPAVNIIVVAATEPRQSASDAADGIEKLALEQKPNLVVWQTGTHDAVIGTDVEDVRVAVEEGVEKLQSSGADVILVNMQYSPRTESIVAVGAYADAMRWVARERNVPVFDRLAIMRYWYESGQFNLYAATRDLGMAKQVHECLGRALASLIIDGAHLEAQEGATVQ